MNILITNDDGYQAEGIRILTDLMSQFGNVSVIAPKTHQSGMSMAVTMGFRPIAHRVLEERDGMSREYIDATPASCVKFALNTRFADKFPDVVVSGINHGSNAATASCYSGTLGAAEEAALNGIPAIGVSLATDRQDADFSSVTEYFPGIFRHLMEHLPEKPGIFYNLNFPDIPAGEVKGIRAGMQGKGKWIREFRPWNNETLQEFGKAGLPEPDHEEGEDIFVLAGEFQNAKDNPPQADHILNAEGFISIVAHNLDNTDREEFARLKSTGIERDFRH